jgi:hypothetical protein
VSINRDRGKRSERVIARLLNGTRVGTMGNEDVHLDGPWSAEVKSRKCFVACEWMAQATRNAPDGKTPVLIVHVHGKRHNDDLVIVKMEDWIEWFGQLQEKK